MVRLCNCALVLNLLGLMFHIGIAAPKRCRDIELTDSDTETLDAKRSKLTDSESEHEAKPVQGSTLASTSAKQSQRQTPSNTYKDRLLNWDLLKSEIKGQCPCSMKQLNRGRGNVKSCYEPFRKEEHFEKLKSDRTSWAKLHKLDQDRVLFDRLRQLGFAQGQLNPSTGQLMPNVQFKLRYQHLGIDVCRDGLCNLMGIGVQPRFMNTYCAIKQAKLSPPVDMRYIERPLSLGDVTGKRSEVIAHIDTLYENVAERLPEHTDNRLKFEPINDDINPDDAYNNVKIKLEAPPQPLWEGHECGQDELRSLPPGSIREQWGQYNDLNSGSQVSYRFFWSIWGEHFSGKLDFRGSFQHAVCAVCIKHKLLLREFANDLESRISQRRLYDAHLTSQYQDRRVYWWYRGRSRQLGNIICIWIDGMDQAKFAWPRSVLFAAHMFDGFYRPKLHITAAIVHGYFDLFVVSDNDMRKSGSTTVEILCMCLTKLSELGVDLGSTHLHIQMDNAGNQNKNNIVFLYLAFLAFCGIVSSATAMYLRTGHTHEDGDRDFSSLATAIKRRTKLDTVEHFMGAIKYWLENYPGRPYEKGRFVRKLDYVRDWKSWLFAMGKTVSGIAGPQAPHWFEFVRRGGLKKKNAVVGRSPL
jgi:hypothetical protein